MFVTEAEQFLIPTISRAKISRLLSYPIGAAAISEALAETAQASSIQLHFYFWTDFHLRNGRYEFLRVEYLNDAVPFNDHPISSLYQRPPQYRWEIIVQPVPRVMRHRINQYILDTALPATKLWLNQRAGLSQKGSTLLTFFFDEKAEEFKSLTGSHLEPLR
jgi:hypothetical protein